MTTTSGSNVPIADSHCSADGAGLLRRACRRGRGGSRAGESAERKARIDIQSLSRSPAMWLAWSTRNDSGLLASAARRRYPTASRFWSMPRLSALRSRGVSMPLRARPDCLLEAPGSAFLLLPKWASGRPVARQGFVGDERTRHVPDIRGRASVGRVRCQAWLCVRRSWWSCLPNEPGSLRGLPRLFR